MATARIGCSTPGTPDNDPAGVAKLANGRPAHDLALMSLARWLSMLAWLVVLLLISASGPAAASEATAVAGDTVKLGGTSYRLDGVVAPSPDQVCLDANAIAWACGVGARDRLAALISMATVGCHDNGVDPLYPERRVGLCWVEGDDLSLNQRLVREGWALSFEPYPRGSI
jgi:endonuclease YncB( thermonuclease family)